MCFILDWLFTIILSFWAGVDLSIYAGVYKYQKSFLCRQWGRFGDFIRKSIDFVLSIHGLCTEFIVLTPFDCFKLNSKNNVGVEFQRYPYVHSIRNESNESQEDRLSRPFNETPIDFLTKDSHWSLNHPQSASNSVYSSPALVASQNRRQMTSNSYVDRSIYWKWIFYFNIAVPLEWCVKWPRCQGERCFFVSWVSMVFQV